MTKRVTSLFNYKIARLYSFVLLSQVLLTACGGSESETNTSDNEDEKNIYANGFKLTQLTSTLNFRSDDPVTITGYQYDFARKEIIITRSADDAEDEPSLSQLRIDDAGRLVGGSFDYTFGSFFGGTADYTLGYDTEGRVVEFVRSVFDNHTFNYNDNFLTDIVHRLSSDTYTFTFTYDAQGLRATSFDAVTSATTHYEYNGAGQIVSAARIDQFGDSQFSYEFAYDEHGNHIATSAYTPFGVLFSTDIYTYEPSSQPVFNHGIMRQSIEPFEATNSTFVR